jgi:hypothetical protein
LKEMPRQEESGAHDENTTGLFLVPFTSSMPVIINSALGAKQSTAPASTVKTFPRGTLTLSVKVYGSARAGNTPDLISTASQGCIVRPINRATTKSVRGPAIKFAFCITTGLTMTPGIRVALYIGPFNKGVLIGLAQLN